MVGLSFRMFKVDRIEDRGTMHRVQVQLVMGELRTELGMLIQVKQDRLSATTAMNSEYFKDKMLLMQAQENRVALEVEKLLFIAGGKDNAINKNVDEQPIQDLALNGRLNRGQGNNPRGKGAAGYGGAQKRVGNANPGGQDNSIDEDVDEQLVQNLSLNIDNVFQADDCDAFDSDVDEAPTAQTMFMVNLSSADPIYDEAGPSYDSDILSEVHDHDHYQDAICKHHEEHEMYDNVLPNHVVNSYADYTSDSNMIPYDQYVKDNVVPGVQSNVSFVPNDAYMMIYNDMYEPHA
nr:hypothetical protein [Tanacetum cinerariifolium]